MSVEVLIKDGVGTVTVDNPPVNALGQAVRQGLIDVLARALADSDVQAIVLIGKGKTFVATGLIRHMRSTGRPVAAIKPVVSGFDPVIVTEPFTITTGLLIETELGVLGSLEMAA